MSIKHIIWDWNGTLLDDSKLIIELTIHYVKKYYKQTITPEEYVKAYEHPIINTYKNLCKDFNEEVFPELAREWFESYASQSLNTSLFDDSLNVLQEFKSLGVSQSIVSALNHELLDNMINRFQLTDFFFCFDGLQNIAGESKISIALNQFSNLNIKPIESVVIGDSIHDLEVAKEIGSNCILLTGGADCEEKLRSSNNLVLNSRTEALDAVKNMRLR